jgi:hypothetical protein
MKTRLIAVCTSSALLAACATTPPGEPVLPVPTDPPHVATTRPYPWVEDEPPLPVPILIESGAVRAIEYFSRTRQRPARELRTEYDAVRKAFANSRSDYDRIRLALLLGLPNAPFNDDGQALELLEPLARDSGNEYNGLAQLVATLLAEQRRRTQQATALQQKLDRIKSLEKEMQQRAATPESKSR